MVWPQNVDITDMLLRNDKKVGLGVRMDIRDDINLIVLRKQRIVREKG